MSILEQNCNGVRTFCLEPDKMFHSPFDYRSLCLKRLFCCCCCCYFMDVRIMLFSCFVDSPRFPVVIPPSLAAPPPPPLSLSLCLLHSFSASLSGHIRARARAHTHTHTHARTHTHTLCLSPSSCFPSRGCFVRGLVNIISSTKCDEPTFF